MNSIKDQMTKEIVIDELHLTLGHPNRKPCLIVEGNSDIRFLNQVLDECFLWESYSGKEGVKEICKEFESENLIIGICDRDYSTEKISNVLYYDYSCLETMLFSNKVIVERLLNIITFDFDYEKIFSKIKDILCYIGAMRNYVFINSLGISFDGISPKEYYVDNQLQASKQKVLDKLKSRYKNLPFKETDIQKIIKSTEPFYLIQGHDLCKLLAVIFGKSFSQDEIERALYLSCTPKSFESFKLYTALKSHYKNVFKLKKV